MVSNHKLKEMLFFILLVVSGALSYIITNATNQEGLYYSGGTFGGGGLNKGFIIEFIIILVVFILLFGFAAIMLGRKFSSSHNTNTSSLLNWKQVKREQRGVRDRYFFTKKEKEFRNEKRSLPISQNLKLTEKGAFEHVVAIVPTGGGKTSSLLLPQLESLDDVSIVVTDPKGEIHHKTKKMMHQKGYAIAHLNLYEPEKSIRYNLLQGCKTPDEVRKLAETILGDDQWGKLSQDVFQAFLFKAWEKGESLSEVIEYIANSSNDILEMELEMFSDVGDDSLLAFKQFAKTAQGDSYVSSVFATINGKLGIFKFKNIRAISEQPNFHFGMLREHKIILYISYPEDEAAIYQPFLASFYYQMMNQVKAHPSVNQTGGYKGKRGLPVYFLLDEFANIGKLPAIDEFLSTIRSKDMSLEIFLQSYAQLEKQYGRNIADIIIENCKTKVTMAGVTKESAQLFSDLAGKTMIESTSISYGEGKSTSMSTSRQAQEVVTMDDVRRMKKYDLFIVSANLRPIKDDKMFSYYDDWDFWFFKYLTWMDDDKAVALGRKLKWVRFWKK